MAGSGRLLLFVTLVGVAGAGGWAARRAAAQTTSPPDTLSTLLTEVRGLRVAIEQMATAGPRIQLALGRLQLQEQRINNMLRRLETVRGEVEEIQKEHDELQRQLQTFETADNTNVQHRQEIEAMTRHLKPRLTATAARLQQRQTEENTLSADIGTEQARWTDFNQRLEELERALSRK